MISLLDAPNAHLIDVWVAFYDHPPERRLSWMWKLLEPGFSHVECWREDRGAWVRFDPCLEFLNAEVHLQPPWAVMPHAKFVHVIRLAPLGKVRESFMIGPVTCVELTKAAIGLRAPLVRTPFALYKHLRKTECSSFSVSLWLRSLLWRSRRRLRSCVASLTSFGRKTDEIAIEAEGTAGGGSAARASGRGSGETGRTGEHQGQVDAECVARVEDVPELPGVARTAFEHVRSTAVRAAR